MILKTALLIPWLLLAAGCAKIADPLPPQVRIPKPAADLAAFQLADQIVLTFSMPVVNTDGSPATTLHRVQVLRLPEDPKEPMKRQRLPEKTFLERAETILTIESEDFPDFMQNGSFTLRDTGAVKKKSSLYPPAFRYAVLFVNDKNQAAGLSNQVRVASVSLPPHPSGFSAQVTEDSIRLEWEAPTENTDGTKPARIAGYNIYKSAEREKMPEEPINSAPVEGPAYEDRNFQFDRTYYYRISTVGSLKDPYAESLPSRIYSVETRDTFPPAPPENFNAALEGSAVILLWAPSSSGDVAGYRLFRRDKEAKTPQLLESALITTLSYRDENALPDKNYEYTIRAVDTHGNESRPVRTEPGIE